ncbi:cupin domain-containing protein [Mycobacterium branderi]|uniref:Cupin n=1 Tax=Mycobacterium branderi TaxID=43348 RepID=A0A7I7W9G9_9MYCO|nr:cupin domain-containing protein [Mycobacterium branderi]MCV7234300.1 cupin domain-containing protein [Mycobacterium branderi]ORA38365.1 cupin [Mycobacterium branderi]BBZ13143.1 cupin [Mycobacterium branderi]
MTFHDERGAAAPAFLTPETQQVVRFLGGLIRVRAGGDATVGQLAILEHQAERGYNSPMHRHNADEETFLVLDGELRVEVNGEAQAVGAGAVAFLPRRLPHAFVVTSPQARFLTLHTPAGFERFTLAAGTPAETAGTPAADELPPDPAALAAMAASYGIEIVGPPPTP